MYKLEHLASPKNLDQIDIGQHKQITDSGLSTLKNITALENLDHGQHLQITDNSGLSRLEDLAVPQNPPSDLVQCDKITESDQTRLRRFSTLQCLFKSIFFGHEGSYNILGNHVEFTSQSPYIPTSFSMNTVQSGIISKLIKKCMASPVFCSLIQAYAHTLIHEMGHAAAYKLITGQNTEIHISTSSYPSGGTLLSECRNMKGWKKSVIDVAGPLSNIFFSSCKLVAAAALKKYISWPVALLLGGGAVLGILDKLAYSVHSALNRNYGDFGCIARQGNVHLAVASTALISEVALGILLTIKLAA